MNTIARTIERLVKGMNFVGILAAVLMAVFVFLSAVMRYAFGQPLRFSNEFVGLLFVSMAFLSMPMAQWQRRHIGVDLLTSIMPEPLQKAMEAIASLILIGFCSVFTIVSYDYLAFARMLSTRSEVGELLLWPWIALMPISAITLAIVATYQLLELTFGLVRHYRPHATDRAPGDAS